MAYCEQGVLYASCFSMTFQHSDLRQVSFYLTEFIANILHMFDEEQYISRIFRLQIFIEIFSKYI